MEILARDALTGVPRRVRVIHGVTSRSLRKGDYLKVGHDGYARVREVWSEPAPFTASMVVTASLVGGGNAGIPEFLTLYPQDRITIFRPVEKGPAHRGRGRRTPGRAGS